MQHGAPRIAIFLANDLRSGARQEADRDRDRLAVSAGSARRAGHGPDAPRRLSLDVVRQRIARVQSARAVAR